MCHGYLWWILLGMVLALVAYGGSSSPGLAVWPEDNKSNGLTQLPSAKQVELDIQENLVPRRHGRW